MLATESSRPLSRFLFELLMDWSIDTEAWFGDGTWWSSGTTVAIALGLVVASALAWLANLITLPGNWVMVLLAGIYALWGPASPPASIHWGTVVGMFALALAGEGIEFIAGAAGAKRAGASRRATLYAMIGSMIGAILGAIIGVPVPIIGSLLAALLFGGLGATAGAMYGEWSDGRQWSDTWTIGHGAFWGRVLGTLGKLLAGLAILLVILVAICVG